MGLELKPSKTRLTHTLNRYEKEEPGFNFLGFFIRQFSVGKHHSGKSTHGELLGFKTIITPSEEKQRVHNERLSDIVLSHKSAPQAALITHLNPVIRGWSNYYSTVVSQKVFEKIDNTMYQRLKVWANRRHQKKSGKWIAKRYWQTIDGDNWVFATKQGSKNPLRLLRHGATPIVRHVKVKGESSPLDGNLVYWSTRMGNTPEMPARVATLLKRQKGKCTHCELYFREDDVMEIDHRIPKSQGGKDSYDNWQLLHRHCHDTKTANDGSLGKQSGCNSTEPKPTKRLERAKDKWVMRYA